MTNEEKYKKVALDLLKAYFKAKQCVIGEFSFDFIEDAKDFKKEIMGYIKALDEDEKLFDELAENGLIKQLLEDADE